MQQSDYSVIDGVLFHSRVTKAKRTELHSHYQLVVPQCLKINVLKLFHDSPLGAHGGIQDTIDKIKEHYYFQRLATVVYDYVKSCPACQSRKITPIHTHEKIVAYPTPSAPFQVWQIDLYGPLPCSSSGNIYIFTALDMFSKFLVNIPIASKDALTVSSAVYQLVTMYGVCDTLIADQGSEFMAKVTKEVCRLLQIPQQFTPAFMHHCLGAVERAHATLATRLTPYMDKGCRNWESVLPSVTFAMDSAVNSSLGYSPFEILIWSKAQVSFVFAQPY